MIKEFIKHVKESTNEMLDIIDNNGEYQERFNVTIKMNGKSITIGNNADLYIKLMDLLYGEIEEEPCHILEP
jgi:hypothetical protein